MIIVGIHGFATAGKDAAASRLTSRYGFVRYAFADPMRTALLALNPHVQIRTPVGNRVRYVRLAELVAKIGWDEAKKHPEVRVLMQRFGTEAGRDVYGQDHWVTTTFRHIKAAHIERAVVTDVRFRNEAQEIVCSGGEMWRITRPGVAAVNDHVSDNELATYEFNLTIDNRGTLDQLFAKVDRLAKARRWDRSVPAKVAA